MNIWRNTLKYRFRLNCSIESSQPHVSAHLCSTTISNPWLGPSCLPQLPVNRHLVPETEHYPVIYGWVVPLNHPLPASQPKLGAGMQESNLIQPLKRTTDIHVYFSCSCHRWHGVIYGFMDAPHVLSIFIGRICLWYRVHKARADVWRRNVLALAQLLMSRWQIQTHMLYTVHHENSKQFSVLLFPFASFSLIFLHIRKEYRTNVFPFFLLWTKVAAVLNI